MVEEQESSSLELSRQAVRNTEREREAGIKLPLVKILKYLHLMAFTVLLKCNVTSSRIISVGCSSAKQLADISLLLLAVSDAWRAKISHLKSLTVSPAAGRRSLPRSLAR